MSNPTTPFGWQMPTNTDLVTDLPADFEVFGQAVATSMQYLLGGTTGQVLSKTSATNMAFTWVTPEIGDITAVNTTAPLTGGGTTGSLTLAVSAGSTSAAGVLQITDSTSSTSTTTAASPNSVKSSYDLATAAIPKSIVTTNGDLIYGTGSATVSRLGIGSSGQVLQVASGVPAWTTPTAGGMTLISTITASSGGTIQFSSIPTTYKHLYIVARNLRNSVSNSMTVRFNSDTGATSYGYSCVRLDSTYSNYAQSTGASSMTVSPLVGGGGNTDVQFEMTIPRYTDTNGYQIYNAQGWQSGQTMFLSTGNYFARAAAITDIQFTAAGGGFATSSTMYLYGVN